MRPPAPPTVAVEAPTARPTRISGSPRTWVGPTAVGAGAGAPGLPAGVQLPITSHVAAPVATSTRPHHITSAPVVAKPQLDPEVLTPQKRDDRLQVIAG